MQKIRLENPISAKTLHQIQQEGLGDGGTSYTRLTEVGGNLMIVDGYVEDQPAETG